MKVKTESLPTRCEICHQTDLFDAEHNFCTRCAGLAITDVTAVSAEPAVLVRMPFLATYGSESVPFVAALIQTVSISLVSALVLLLGWVVSSASLLGVMVLWLAGAGGSAKLIRWVSVPADFPLPSMIHPLRAEQLRRIFSSPPASILAVTLGGLLGLGLVFISYPSEVVARAALSNDTVLALILKLGVNVNARNDQEQTALMLDARHPEAVRRLVESGAAASYYDMFHTTALMRAASSEDPQAMHWLLKQDANINKQDIVGNTALMEAVKHGNFETTSQLLQAGALVNINNMYGYTALNFAIQRDDKKIMWKLLNRGADLTTGRSPLCEAVRADNYELTHLFLMLQADLINSTYTHNSGYVVLAEVEVDAPDDQDTVLMTAVRHRNIPIVRLLLENGAGINLQNQETKTTALMYAAQNNDALMMALLTQAGADPNMRDKSGKTAEIYQSEAKNGVHSGGTEDFDISHMIKK